MLENLPNYSPHHLHHADGGKVVRVVSQRHVEGDDGIELHRVGNTGVEGGQNRPCFDQVVVAAAEPHHLCVLVFGHHRGDASPDYSQQRQPVLVDQSHLIEVVEGRVLGALERERLDLLDPLHAVCPDVAQEPVNVLVELALCHENRELIRAVRRLRARVRDDELMYEVVQAGPKVVQNVANDQAMAYGRRLDLGCNKLMTARFAIADNLRLEIARLEEVEILPPKLVDERFGTRELAEAALEGGRCLHGPGIYTKGKAVQRFAERLSVC